MEIGLNMDCCLEQISLEDAISLMKKNGFTKTFCMASREDAEAVITKVQDAGIEFESLHAQLANINDMWKQEESGDEMLQKLCENIKLCRKFQIPTLVVHVSAGRPAPMVNDRGLARYDRLMEYAEKNQVKIAYENSRALGNLALILEKYENAGFCWDAGHEYCFTPGMDYMPYFGHKLEAIHIHDNRAILDEDAHMIPFDGVNDMDKIARELAKVNYKKCIMLELSKGTKEQQGIYDDLSMEEFYERAARAARRLAEMVEQYQHGDFK